MSPHRSDFTFRTQLFRNFPNVVRHRPGLKAVVDQKYAVKCQIREDTATYFIGDERYATATYPPGTVPSSGYVGFAVYMLEDIQVENLSVTAL